MYEIINWIIFGAFTVALIVDGVYTLVYLPKSGYGFDNAIILIIIYSLSILLFSNMLLITTPDRLGLSTTLSTLLVDSFTMTVVGFINHGDVVYNYKVQQKTLKNIHMQQPIKI